MSQPSNAPLAPTELALRSSPLAGMTLAAFLGIGLVSCGVLMASGKLQWLPGNVDSDAVLHGEVTHALARQLSATVLAEQAANLERGASWLLLQDSGPRVRQGCPGWLFLTDERRIQRNAEANAQRKVQAVIDLRQRLAGQGIDLWVIVVPDKSRIAASQLCGLYRPEQLQARISAWTRPLQSAGVTTLDLTAALQPLGDAAFLRTDTHWSETGANAAALALARRIKESGFKASPLRDFDTRVAPAAPRPGDLVRLAGLDWLPLSLQPAPQSVAETTISEQAKAAQGDADNLDDLFGDAELPNIALIGTSFSRNSGFVGFLQRALGAPIGNFAKDGGEFSGAANAYFDSPAFTQTPPKLVLWEIPERDLQTAYVPLKP